MVALERNIYYKTNKSMLRISRDMDITHSHFSKLTNLLEEGGYIKSERIKRIKKVRLTNKGKRLVYHVNKIFGVTKQE